MAAAAAMEGARVPTITLKDGDFGAGVEVTVGSDDIYLPDPDRPGLNVMIPLGEVVEIDSIEDDRSGQINEALSLAADGFRQNGPAGLIMGMYAAAKVKDVVFSARLQDGRHFVAMTDTPRPTPSSTPPRLAPAPPP